jgi:hydroxyacylglutathione hydrolase
MAAKTYQFACLQDNFGVLLHDDVSGATAAIDAPEAAAVETALQRTGWKLTDILVTHHHADHTDGIKALKDAYGCKVTAPRAELAKIKHVDATVAEGDSVRVGNLVGKVLETPGHTSGHISYWFEADKLAFVGDTLFSIGCGRVIEGTPAMMWKSLLKLRALPDDTEIYCGHEYTASNIAYAKTVEPNNKALIARAAEVDAQRRAGRPTLPVKLGAEKAANPFLRADVAEVAAAVGLAGKSAVDVFAKVREGKNNFRG